LADIKLGIKNILSAKIRLKKVIYKLKIKDRSKIILENKNIFLVFI
jgi:hypothetical protein